MAFIRTGGSLGRQSCFWRQFFGRNLASSLRRSKPKGVTTNMPLGGVSLRALLRTLLFVSLCFTYRRSTKLTHAKIRSEVKRATFLIGVLDSTMGVNDLRWAAIRFSSSGSVTNTIIGATGLVVIFGACDESSADSKTKP